jgi:hypothetical protein
VSRKWFDPRRLVDFLFSSADDFFKNETVRATLRKEGDNCKTPRLIEHYAYFPTHEARDSYREFISSRGYKIEREDVRANDVGRLVVIFSKVQAPIAIDRETALLEDRASQLEGDYDGWETEVIRR